MKQENIILIIASILVLSFFTFIKIIDLKNKKINNRNGDITISKQINKQEFQDKKIEPSENIDSDKSKNKNDYTKFITKKDDNTNNFKNDSYGVSFDYPAVFNKIDCLSGDDIECSYFQFNNFDNRDLYKYGHFTVEIMNEKFDKNNIDFPKEYDDYGMEIQKKPQVKNVFYDKNNSFEFQVGGAGGTATIIYIPHNDTTAKFTFADPAEKEIGASEYKNQILSSFKFEK
jgi:hypothetical protein